jgi:hypothetical protein
MPDESVRVYGHVTLEVTAPDGRLIARAEGTNTVVDGGRDLLAKLLAGKATAPAFEVAAGVLDSPTVADLTKLFNTDGLAEVAATVASSAGTVTLTGAFPAADKERSIKEAGLMLTCMQDGLATRTLYNRALVKPAQTVRVGEVLTLTWTLGFAPPSA